MDGAGAGLYSKRLSSAWSSGRRVPLANHHIQVLILVLLFCFLLLMMKALKVMFICERKAHDDKMTYEDFVSLVDRFCCIYLWYSKTSLSFQDCHNSNLFISHSFPPQCNVWDSLLQWDLARLEGGDGHAGTLATTGETCGDCTF